MDVRIRELDHIVKMLVRRDFERMQIYTKQEEQVHELDRIAKMLVRRDLELLQTNETMQLLDEAKAKDEALLASIGDGMIATDGNGTITIINKQAELLLHASTYDLVGKNWFNQIVLEDEKGNVVVHEKMPIQVALSTGKKTTESIYSYRRKDATTFPVAITASPILLRRKITGAVVIFRDITREKAIDRAKSEFVSLASHQLKTPLTSINWYVEMLLKGDVDETTQKRYLSKLYLNNRRMVQLVNALLNVSRIELGTLVLDAEPVDLVEVAESVLEELSHQIQQKALRIEKTYEKNLPMLSADPQLMHIILLNLLNNAVKYTPSAGTVGVAIEKRGPDALLTVSDTGYGIPKNQQEQIFTKLFRADNIREKETDGTGLGLYIVKSVVEQSGGSIRFESEEDKGTTFYVTVPFAGAKEREKTEDEQ